VVKLLIFDQQSLKTCILKHCDLQSSEANPSQIFIS